MVSTQQGTKLLPFVRKRFVMPTLIITFAEADATLDRLSALADELGITPEMLAKRAILQHLGEYMLTEQSTATNPTRLQELFTGVGLMKNK